MRELIVDSFAGGGAYYNENDRKAAFVSACDAAFLTAPVAGERVA